MPPTDQSPFDPRSQLPKQPFVPTTTVRVAGLVEWFAELLTSDPYYRILYGEILKHVLLGVLVLPASLIFKYVSTFFDPTEGPLDSIAYYSLRTIEVGVIIFALYFVVVALVDTAARVSRRRWLRWKVEKEADPPRL